jgi:hypothetical protein
MPIESPNRRPNEPLPKVTEDKLPSYLDSLLSRLGSYGQVAEFLDVSKALVWRAHKEGYIPKDNELRRRLGLPEIVISKKFRDPESGRFMGG